jgi:hypothetical protein
MKKHLRSIPILTKQTTVMATSNYNETTLILKRRKVEELKGFYGNLISYCCA